MENSFKLKKIKVKQIILFITILIAFLLFEAIFIPLGYDFNNLSKKELYIMTFSKYFFLILFFILYYYHYLKEKLFDFKKNFKNYFNIAFKDWLTGFIIMYIANIFIMQIIGSIGQNEQNVQEIISSTPLIALLLTTLFAPFIEEMLFRKNLQDCFHNKYLFMITSGLLFGLVHVLEAKNPLEYLLIIPYGALGVSFAHTLNKTDNIYATIMMHAFHNGILTLYAILVNL